MTITSESPNSLSETLFAGGGEMGALMRAHNWSKSKLGPVETWPQSLRTGIRIILGSRYPMFIWWGRDLINLYNDAYIPVLGKRHPTALGESASDIWAELWHSVGPFAYDVLDNGNPSWNEEFLEIMERNGYREETYFTFSYSPIGRDEDGVGGIFCACTEDTRRVIDDRRLRTLRELGAETAHAKTVNEACQISADVLANNPKDIPFSLIYLFDSDHQQARLVSTTNLEMGSPVSPRAIKLVPQASDCWLLHAVLATGENRVIHQLIARFGPLPGGAWDESPDSAIALPLTRPGQETLGVLIAGISPYRPLDDDYRGFFSLVAGQVTTAIANTLAYEEERLRAEALAELDRAKTTFFSNVSHEFRTPLTLMLGPLEDALSERDAPLSPGQQQRLEVIQRNGLRLLKLVNTLLDFSRIESARISAVYEPTALATFTAELASVFRSALERAKLRFVVDCPPLPEPIYVDREMWEKIVLNLISNAFKFTFTGAITVRLHLVGNQVELAVEDTGIGIPTTEIGHLFERFYRVKGAPGRTFEGSGIGLSLCKELVKLHGGTVEVSSVEGEGSCFRVFIPTGCAHLPAERIEATRTLASTAMGASPYVEEALRWLSQEGNGKWGVGSEEKSIPTPDQAFAPTYPHIPSSASSRILLVDDNADMRDYLRRLLSERWQVETAANGAIALNMIQQQLPDLVLTDVMMPEMDGFQLLKALRVDTITQSIPIILLSARAGEEATVVGLEAGADDYLIKPFSARELIARVETQLQMSRLRQELSANRFKNEFLMTVTHELQSPLATILGWARFLQNQSLDATKVAGALAAIERNATIEAKLVKDLLDVASILSGKLRLKSQVVDLVALIQSVVTTFRPVAESKKIQLLVEMISDSRLSNVVADGDRLKQVITNLLENAIKFTPQGGQVTIRLERLGSDVEIIVSDTGIGIRPDFLPYVFARFTQAEVPSRHTPGGVGIGLALAHYLVELHHGTIQVASEGEGRGATFTVRLPLNHPTQPNSDA
ncbi:MAG: response regulator [Chroococcidiopsidaceae cyanobacterium CP_BM_ER_R8_30]|nr:response regulator [Chroococcidiopsidaceae cyanobacterium CP_BM_ER_R8_30]